MRLRNLIVLSILTILSLSLIIMCQTDVAYRTGEFVPFEYPVPDGLITDEAEKEAMIQAKIENLEATNKVYWGVLPADNDTLQKGFQSIWGFIRSNFPGFHDIIKSEENPDGLDWDEVGENGYYDIEFMDNYGDFARLLTWMGYVLKEGHTNISTQRLSGGNNLTPFRQNVPMISTSVFSRIGACYTVTEEEKLVVKEIITPEENPYDLRIGDEIVGFNGVPWDEWLPYLLEANIPINGSPASSDGAIRYNLLRSGMTNVNLFEKINILRYDTGEVETYPVEFIPFSWVDYHPCIEYVGDAPGVKTPEISIWVDEGDVLTSGILPDENIGYIYLTECPSSFDEFDDPALWDPYKTEISEAFSSAVSQLLDTDGLIIDLRFNTGGRNEVFYKGLSKLIDADEDIDVFSMLGKDTSNPHILALDMPLTPNESPLIADDESYDKPIVVLTGPDCISACDFLIAFFDRFPQFTIIGSHNNGSFTGVAPREYDLGEDIVFQYISSQVGAYVKEAPDYDGPSLKEIKDMEYGDEKNELLQEYLFSHYELLIRRSDFVDEFVWHTKDSIINGVDRVRERAIEIIKSNR